MTPETIEAVQQHPKFRELIRRRGRLSRILAGLVLAIFTAFLSALAFAPGLVTRPIGEGFLTTLGIVFCITFIIGLVVMTAIYVRRANNEFEDLARSVREDFE